MTTSTYTFRSSCAYCPKVVLEVAEYSGPYDSEGHAVFNGDVECFRCFTVLCTDCLARQGRCRIHHDCPIRPPV